ncbi:unnamed protein product [Urochloa humidicola]
MSFNSNLKLGKFRSLLNNQTTEQKDLIKSREFEKSYSRAINEPCVQHTLDYIGKHNIQQRTAQSRSMRNTSPLFCSSSKNRNMTAREEEDEHQSHLPQHVEDESGEEARVPTSTSPSMLVNSSKLKVICTKLLQSF